MTVVSPPFVLQAGSHPASTIRQNQQLGFGSPFGSFAGGVQPTTAGGGHGVGSPTDLVATQNGTPNMTVLYSGGMCAIRGTESAHQGVYTVYNDGQVSLAVSASDPTNPRRSIGCMRVRDAAYSGASNDAALVLVDGPPSGAPVDPSLPANSLALDRITVPASATSITNANITRLAARATALGGVLDCSSTTRPTGSAVYNGLDIYERDTFRHCKHNGTGWVVMSEPLQAWVPTWQNVAGGSVTASYNRSDGKCWWSNRYQLAGAGVTGRIRFALPFQATGVVNVGSAGFVDTGTTTYQASPSDDGTNVYLDAVSAAGTYAALAISSGTVPFAFGNTDVIFASGWNFLATRHSF